MSNLQGFWSYVHDDDEAEGGRIEILAHDVAKQFGLMTGENIDLFFDKDVIEWGDHWREKIDSSLASVAFIIPVLTPRFFMSEECRRELQYFIQVAAEHGVRGLILPLIYCGYLSDEDTLKKSINEIQHEDWRDIRLLDVTTEGYRQGVAHLASRLVEAYQQTENKPTTAKIIDAATEINDDEKPGFMDSLASAEEEMAKLPDTLNLIKPEIEDIGQIMTETASEIKRADSQGSGFSGRLVITKRLASRLDGPIDRIWLQSNEYASHLHAVDIGYVILINRVLAEIKENANVLENYCPFFNSIKELYLSVAQAINSMKEMVRVSEPLENWSRDLRPRLRKLNKGITILIESSGVIHEWAKIIDSSGVVCKDTNEPNIETGGSPSPEKAD